MQKRAYDKSKIPSWFKSLENLEVEETYLIYKATLNPALYQMVKTKSISSKIRSDENLPTLSTLIKYYTGILSKMKECKGDG